MYRCKDILLIWNEGQIKHLGDRFNIRGGNHSVHKYPSARIVFALLNYYIYDVKPLKKILTDPAIYILLGLNLYFIYAFRDDETNYTSIIWLYWCQSVFIGLFNFLDLLTTKNVNADGFKMNDQPVDPKKGRGCYALFFLVHYNAFHLAYLFFIGIDIGFKNIDFTFFKLALMCVFISQLILFVQHKRAYKEHLPKLGNMFFMPYLRIIPMHLMILLPAFLNWKPAVVFLVFKTIFDLVGHLATTPYYWRREEHPPAVAPSSTF